MKPCTPNRSLIFLLLTASCSFAAPASLYVSSYVTFNQLVFNTATGKGIAKLAGDGGSSTVISRNGLVLANYNGSDIEVINTQTKTLTNTISIGFLILPSIAISPNGKTVFSATPSGVIGFFDVASGTMTKSVPFDTGSGVFLAIAPNGQTLYALYGNGIQTLCSISVPNASVNTCLQVSPNAYNTEVFSRALVVSSDNSRVYGFSDPYSIGVFDATSLVLLNSIQLVDPAGAAVDSLVYSPEMNSVYVSSYGFGGPNTIFRIDLSSFTVAAQAVISFEPLDVAVTPSGAKVYPVGFGSPSPVLDGTTLAQTGTITPGYGTSAVVGPY